MGPGFAQSWGAGPAPIGGSRWTCHHGHYKQSSGGGGKQRTVISPVAAGGRTWWQGVYACSCFILIPEIGGVSLNTISVFRYDGSSCHQRTSRPSPSCVAKQKGAVPMLQIGFAVISCRTDYFFALTPRNS